jgi:ABC-type antimicrobial peptide transport system permease subunit
VGAIAGGGLAALAVRLVDASFLFRVERQDPATYAGVAVFLLIVAAIASVLPALRILKLDPAKTLRQ